MDWSWLADCSLKAVVFAPALVTGCIGLGWLLGWTPRERTLARLTAGCSLSAALAAAVLGLSMVAGGLTHVTTVLGTWFQVEHHGFPLVLHVDRLSLPLVGLSVVLVGTIGAFSVRYLHRDPGFYRFFFLLNLFGFGILLLFTAGSFDLLIGGWELVGLTSVFLIGFFQHRDEPVQSALRAFATYRACDVGLLAAAVMLHRYVGTAAFATLFPAGWPSAGGLLAGREAAVVGSLLLLAAMGKAAQVPFSGWLPRAMEGPTPSSAVFYGALSVHAGAYLLLRAQPILAVSPAVSAAVVVVGLLTAVHGTLAGRVAADAKTSLAHASLTQLGLIFVEIGLGWHWLAVLHIVGHSAVRTLEFLRAPSMLHDFHHLHAAAGGHLGKTGARYEHLPERLRLWAYRFALDRSHLDTVLDRLLVGPLMGLAHALHAVERHWARLVVGPDPAERVGPARRAGLRRIDKKPGNVNA